MQLLLIITSPFPRSSGAAQGQAGELPLISPALPQGESHLAWDPGMQAAVMLGLATLGLQERPEAMQSPIMGVTMTFSY